MINWLKEKKAKVGVAVAYGRLMPKAVFEAPKLGCFNIHFSLLPKYRGAGPMQWSLIHGEKETGVTAFWIEEGMDSGPICHQEKISIDPTDDARTLNKKLVDLGLKVLDQVMEDLSDGKVTKNPQQGEPSLAPILKKEDGKINWAKPAEQISNLLRCAGKAR